MRSCNVQGMKAALLLVRRKSSGDRTDDQEVRITRLKVGNELNIEGCLFEIFDFSRCSVKSIDSGKVPPASVNLHEISLLL